jgi:metal-dependent HD superfamily phosphatase/phosphodiesterase/YHS domain-containing protein
MNHGIRIRLDWDYHQLAHGADQTIRVLTEAHPRAATLYTRLLADPQTLALWDMTAYMTVEKLGYNDHSQMHAQIVAANALQLLSLFLTTTIEPDVVASGAGTVEDATLVVLISALLHDIGNQVARENHELYSVMLAQPILTRLLPLLYNDPVQQQIITSFILSAIASHDCTSKPSTLEAAIVAVADAIDMTKGRGQVAFDRGKADIHAVSAMAIEQVVIKSGKVLPVQIEVVMSNPAGLFQVEKLLGRKLILTELERYIDLRACVSPIDGAVDEALQHLVLQDGRFVPEVMPPIESVNTLVDPVCGMTLLPSHTAGSLVYQEKNYHFCSNDCLARFQLDPMTYQ